MTRSSALDQLVDRRDNADPKRARECHAGWVPLGGAFEGRAQRLQLAFTTNERHGPKDSGGLVDTGQ